MNGAPLPVSVVIPVYNSAPVLPELIDRLGAVLAPTVEGFEVILVNDGSRDGSWGAIQGLAARLPWVTGIDLMRNYGQHNALLCGIRAARGELTVTLDDDLQHRPEDIPALLALLDPETDVVYGTPEEERHGLLRDAASRLTKLALERTMGAGTARMVSSFRVFRTRLRDAFTGAHGGIPLDVLLTWGTTRFRALPVRHEVRKVGASNYTFRKLVRHALNMITGFSVLPLRLASLLALLFTLFGFAALVWVVGRTLLQGIAVPGFAMIASLVSILSGVQLLSLGILGEYVARIHLRLMDSPPYAVRATVNRHDG
ncbi:MAG TPA: glycosyltransferase family 2 protein [Thermoanaerobaculia bacterium]|nr:glycosyltransferase family 2 protein [Thermoanaerobaculia bacterium]